MLITFSGLDGAGKSTLIAKLAEGLEKRNHRVTVLTMYDHVGVYALMRAARRWLSNAMARRQARRTPNQELSNCPHSWEPCSRRPGSFAAAAYKTVRSTRVKRWVYLLDLFLFLVCRLYVETIKNHILILDRYFYDSLADVASHGRWLYIRWFMFLVPNPDAPVFVDLSPERAFARKSEYSVEYLSRRRAIYQRLFSRVPRPIAVVNDDLNASFAALDAAVAKRIAR